MRSRLVLWGRRFVRQQGRTYVEMNRAMDHQLFWLPRWIDHKRHPTYVRHPGPFWKPSPPATTLAEVPPSQEVAREASSRRRVEAGR